MTNEDYEELKRVCRIRGVPEPTEATAGAFIESQCRETNVILRELAEKLRNAGPFVPGPGYPIPERFLRDGKIDSALIG